MDDVESLLLKIDALQASVNAIIKRMDEREAVDFDRDVEANLVADFIFEAVMKPDSFFDANG